MYTCTSTCTCTAHAYHDCLIYSCTCTVHVPDQRFEEYHHNSDEVCRVDNVELLEVLFVPGHEGEKKYRLLRICCLPKSRKMAAITTHTYMTN